MRSRFSLVTRGPRVAFFFFSSRRRHTRWTGDWSSDVCSSDLSKIYGPVKTQFGYYVFKVTKVTPASQQTLTQATPTIKQLLQSQNQQKALDDFVKDFQKRWKDKTDCRSGFVTQDCKNAPKAKTPSTVAPGWTQQNAPPANSGTTTGG